MVFKTSFLVLLLSSFLIQVSLSADETEIEADAGKSEVDNNVDKTEIGSDAGDNLSKTTEIMEEEQDEYEVPLEEGDESTDYDESDDTTIDVQSKATPPTKGNKATLTTTTLDKSESLPKEGDESDDTSSDVVESLQEEGDETTLSDESEDTTIPTIRTRITTSTKRPKLTTRRPKPTTRRVKTTSTTALDEFEVPLEEGDETTLFDESDDTTIPTIRTRKTTTTRRPRPTTRKAKTTSTTTLEEEDETTLTDESEDTNTEVVESKTTIPTRRTRITTTTRRPKPTTRRSKIATPGKSLWYSLGESVGSLFL